MKCPYCSNEMKKGIISGDGRSNVYFNAGDKPPKIIDKISGAGLVTAVKYHLVTFTLEAYFCGNCKKVIIDTDVAK